MKAKAKPVRDKKVMNRKRRQILDFARDNKLIINAGVGYDYSIDSYFMFGHCPCDAKRPDCPCPEAVGEVKEKGCCKCRLFWRDYDVFKDKMIAKEVTS